MSSIGLSSDYVNWLCTYCLESPPEILACDVFKSQALLVNGKTYICNLDKSTQSGSHYVAIIVKNDSILYFDSFGMPPLNADILFTLNKSEKSIYYSTTMIQSVFSIFCGVFCISFLCFGALF